MSVGDGRTVDVRDVVTVVDGAVDDGVQVGVELEVGGELDTVMSLL